MKAAILGVVGVPGNYGGFETLADNLVVYHEVNDVPMELSVYCSNKAYPITQKTYRTATLHYISLDANGAESILFDILGLFDAVIKGHKRILLLGVSGAISLPLLRLVPRLRVITNVDGIEWKRQKWRGLSRWYLRLAERIAANFSHVVVADNDAIAEHLKAAYGCSAVVIPYGGDHAVQDVADFAVTSHLPDQYALGLCRIEPENNVHLILEAYEDTKDKLVFVGNWDKSAYGRKLRARYCKHPSIIIHDPIYDKNKLRAIREKASIYLHGHSAGGTNPALVEMMHFGVPIAAHGCSFNRYTTEGKALYFETASELRKLLDALTKDRAAGVGRAMLEIALRRYTWDQIGRSYFELLSKN